MTVPAVTLHGRRRERRRRRRGRRRSGKKGETEKGSQFIPLIVKEEMKLIYV